MKTLIIANEQMIDIMKIFKSLEESGLLITGSNKTIEKELKWQKRGFFSMLLGTLGTLGASLLGYLLVGKGMTAKRRGQGVKS